jgi:hypothetical protein
MDDARLDALADQLVAVRGVVAVVLGGSRARGLHRPDSDYDLGLYYRTDLDLAALEAIAACADAPVQVWPRGGWGPWVDGGAWLTIGGARVDWIYRDLDRVHRVWADCQAGRYEVAIQAGHPLGYYSHTYAGEAARCRILADPTGELAALQAETRHYPPALAAALLAALWQADFQLAATRYAAAGADPVYAAGCLFHLVGTLCHALHARAGAWLLNEKAMVAATAQLAIAPPGFAAAANALVGQLTDRASITAAADAAARLIAAVRAVI